MERSEGFKRSETTIKALEGQLAACGRVLKECELAEVKAQQKIEEHFDKCMNALAARKDALLRIVEERVSTYKKNVEVAQAKAKILIEAAVQTQKAATLVYGVDINSAELLWKGLSALSIGTIEYFPIQVILPNTLFAAIQIHGEVCGNTVQMQNLHMQVDAQEKDQNFAELSSAKQTVTQSSHDLADTTMLLWINDHFPEKAKKPKYTLTQQSQDDLTKTKEDQKKAEELAKDTINHLAHDLANTKEQLKKVEGFARQMEEQIKRLGVETNRFRAENDKLRRDVAYFKNRAAIFASN